VALCSVLPGPTSTQTIVSIGYKTGGPLLAFFTMLVWAFPVLVAMTALSFLYQFLDRMNMDQSGLRYIGPMAVGFIIVAAYRIGRKVVTDKLTILLLLFGAITTYFIRAPWIYPLVLIIGGGVAVLASKKKNIWNHVKLSPPWPYFVVFMIFALASVVIPFLWEQPLFIIFESFYRYGYLVFGGGQVVIPVMHSDLVQVHQYMTNGEFLTGYGLVQGLPGPMFSFSAYAGGMAAREYGPLFQILGSIAGGIGIFLPGLLLIYFVYPIWENLKKIQGIKISLKGINAVAGGLITISAVILMQRSGLTIDNLVVTAIAVVLLISKKIPAPLIVLLALALGFIFI